MKKISKYKSGALLSVAGFVLAAQAPTIAFADPITLQSADGGLSFEGEFVEFVDGHYILETQLGPIRIGAANVTCSGAACPDLSNLVIEEPVQAESPAAPVVGGRVILKSFDSALQFEGELVGIENGNYVLRTNLGDMRVATNTVTCEGPNCPDISVTSLVEPVVAPATTEPESKDVTLQSFNGDLQFVGELLGVENGKYVIQTNLGELRVVASTVECIGAACPTIEAELIEVTDTETPFTIDHRINGNGAVGTSLFPELMRGYASSISAVVETRELPAEGGTGIRFVEQGNSANVLGTYLITTDEQISPFNALATGDADITLTERRATETEVRIVQRSGGGDLTSPDQEHILGLDNIAIVTHPSNPLQQISIDDLQRVFTRRITDWAQLGGPQGEIKVVVQAEGTSSRSLFDDVVFGTPSTTLSRFVTAQSVEDLVDQVTSDPMAIGYVSTAAMGRAKPLALAGSCGIAISPDGFTAKTEEYLLTRRVYAYNRSDLGDENISGLVDFIGSGNIDGLVARAGFVNLDVARRVQSRNDPRIAVLTPNNLRREELATAQEMIATVGQFDRLSSTFRFRTGSTILDEKALTELPRLAQYLRDLPNGSNILLVGFSDSVGPFESNRNLSTSRASQVLAALESIAGPALNNLNIEVTGFGELGAVACNDTAQGRALNRRVEVWVSKDDG